MIEIKNTKEENNILNKEELNILKTRATLNNAVEDQHLIMLNPMGLDRNSIGFKTTVTVATYLGVIKSRVPMIISDLSFHRNCFSVYDILQMVDTIVKGSNKECQIRDTICANIKNYNSWLKRLAKENAIEDVTYSEYTYEFMFDLIRSDTIQKVISTIIRYQNMLLNPAETLYLTNDQYHILKRYININLDEFFEKLKEDL